MKVLKVSYCSMILVLIMAISAPVFAEEVILNPGNLTGSVSVTGYQISSITISVLDTDQIYSATITESAPGGAASIDYFLTLEGDRDYHVVAEATVVDDSYMRTVLPTEGPITIPIYENPGDEVTLDMSMEPAIISGTISTVTGAADTIGSYYAGASIYVPGLDTYFRNTSAESVDAPGLPGADYTLLVAPGQNYNWYIDTSINGIEYFSGNQPVTAPAAGATLDKDLVIDVTATTILGKVGLEGIDLTHVLISGIAIPFRTNDIFVRDFSTGDYTFPADAGNWNLRTTFYYDQPGDLSHLSGILSTPSVEVPDLTNGEARTGVDFLVNPGIIPGTLNLWGANVDYDSAQIFGYSATDGTTSRSDVDPDSGRFSLVASPGDWGYGYYQYLSFDYPSDPDSSLRSTVAQQNVLQDIQTVAAGETTSEVNLSFGTATVKYYYHVAGGGILSSPVLKASKQGTPSSSATGYGSSEPTTEGQAMITVLLPGTYDIEAFGTVAGSYAEFGNTTVDVEPGVVIVIGGTNGPTLKVSNPSNLEVICDDEVTVIGTATDDVGIASITINGTSVAFTSTNNLEDPNEVEFSYDLALPVLGSNAIDVVATDIDDTYPIPLSISVIREECGPVTPECDYPLNVEDFDIFIFGDASNIIHNSGNMAAGGNVNLSDFGLNQIAANEVGLVVGQDLTLNNDGFVYGDVYHGGLASIDPSVTIGGDIYPDTELAGCFEPEQEELTECSAFTSRRSANATTEVDTCWFNLTGTDSELNIFELPITPEISFPCGLNLDVPVGSMVVVNVPGIAPAFGQLAFNTEPVPDTDIIWNFYEAGMVNIANTQFPGTIFAPYADVILTSSHVDGAIVANSLHAPNFTGEVDNARFAHWTELCAGSINNESCEDQVQNQDESDVDCGGWCGATCELETACNDDDDCASNYCSEGICAEAPPVSDCSEATAIDIGARGVATTVPNDSCVMIRDGYPSWWNASTINLDTTGTCDGEVPFTWTSTCADGGGDDSFTGTWQRRALTPVSKDCATLIELKGSGGDIGLRWY